MSTPEVGPPETVYSYSLAWPTTDPAEAIRLGWRTPREILLPPYLYINDYFRDFADSIDVVFEPLVDIPTEILGDLRNMWVTNPALENDQITDSTMIPFDAWSQPERQLLVQQVNMLGMKLMSAGLIPNDNYQAISRWLGMYWWGKGTQSFINFINYSLSASLQVVALWTQDYVNFLPAGDSGIGTPIWEGGTWYPTTTVQIISSGGLQNVDIQDLVNFFYEIANYNLVLQAVNIEYTMWITDDPTFQRTDAEVVAVGLWANNSIVISNVARYGVPGPAQYDTAPDVPMGALSVAPTNTNYTGVYMLATPTAWYQDPQGRNIPMYAPADQSIVNTPTLPSTVVGGASTTENGLGFSVLLGPVGWMDVPGSSRSTARVPYFSTTPVQRTARVNVLPSQIVGNNHSLLLVNPTGFLELATNQWVPYW
jgi:hypothetical protein